MILDSIIYLVITDKSYPRKLAFSYLSELSTEFSRSYPPSTSLKAGLRPYAFVKFDTFIQRTKRLYLDPRGAEASGKGGGTEGLTQLNEDLQDVTRIMTKNMEDLLWRGDSLDRMSSMSSSLKDETNKYRKQARQINLDALYRKWAPVGVLGLVFMAVMWWKLCESLFHCLVKCIILIGVVSLPLSRVRREPFARMYIEQLLQLDLYFVMLRERCTSIECRRYLLSEIISYQNFILRRNKYIAAAGASLAQSLSPHTLRPYQVQACL